MSGLRSVIEEVLSTEVGCLSDFELTEEAAETSRAIGLLTHRLAAIAAEAEMRGSYQTEGFLNITRWLAVVADMDNSIARHHVGLGRILRDHSETGRQAAGGDLSQSRVRILARAARRHPDTYREHEDMLLGFANDMEVHAFKKAIDYWANCADAVQAEQEADQQRDDSYLHASQTFAGKVRIDGLFDKEVGETVLTALDAAMNPEARQEGSGDELRPAPQRRADAMHEICRQFLDHHPGRVGGHRPHVSLIIDLETLQGRTGKRCELGHTGTITPETARRIMCDAAVSWMMVNGDTVPLGMGRAVRTATPEQLRALAVRDGGCTWEGCDRPPAWCDAHHIVPWWKGGPTDLDNLRLLCRRHHVLTHRMEREPAPGDYCTLPDDVPAVALAGNGHRPAGNRQGPRPPDP